MNFSPAGHHPGFLTPTGVEITFVLIGLATLGAALLTVTTRQLVHAALWLVVALGGLAIEYLLLTAEFIAWVQVLIYVGSVVVLLLFGLMLTRAPIGRSPDADSENRWVALGVAVAAAGTLVWVVVDAFRSAWINLHGVVRLLPRHRREPVPALGAALRGAVGAAAGRAGRRDRAVAPRRRRRQGELMHLVYPAVLAALLFCVGVYGVLARRNAILVLMSVELMLNAVNLNLVAFDVWMRDTLHAGQALTLFTITIAAAEIGLGLAIVLLVHRNRGTSDIDRLTALADPEQPDGADGADGPGGSAGPGGPGPAADDEKAEATA